MSCNATKNAGWKRIWLSLCPLLAGVVLLLSFAAVNPALHEKLHTASSHPDSCAVCALSHNQVLSTPDMTVVAEAQSPLSRPCRFVFVPIASSPCLCSENQGRSPPSAA